MWKSFKQEYNRQYDQEEEPKRFSVFLENLKIIDERNKAEGQTIHGINKFSDLSQEEFRDRLLGSIPDRSAHAGKAVLTDADIEPYHGASSLVDWSGVFTTPVKDQGYCGSCWAFSATEQLESDAMRQLGTTYLLSTEQVTQCTTGAFGCGGGWTETAYAYIKNSAGVVQESDYPYNSYYGKTGTCAPDTSKAVIGLTSFTTISGESAMATYVQSTGPLSVCVDASTWNSYNGGVMSVCGQSVNHCVQAVGVDNGNDGYWKVRNSWGTAWGESGHIRLAYGKNTCAITNDPTYVAATKK
jgi:C1A family cysteine protease